MKSPYFTIAVIVILVFVIPGTVLYFVDKEMLKYYLITNATTQVPIYLWFRNKKTSCKLFGMKLHF